MDIRKELFKLQDLKYKNFVSKLIPNISPDLIIGIKAPVLKNFAKSIEDSKAFLKNLPHKYLEENTLHAYLISNERDFEKCIELLDEFLPFIDNWATCDSLRPKCFKKYTEELIFHIKRWISSSHTFEVRFGIEMLMTHFLDKSFNKKHLSLVASIKSEEYYINMMIAWYFATALSKQWESTIIYLEEKKLPLWVHNKTIQKAVESFRITPSQKEYLKTLRIKKIPLN